MRHRLRYPLWRPPLYRPGIGSGLPASCGSFSSCRRGLATGGRRIDSTFGDCAGHGSISGYFCRCACCRDDHRSSHNRYHRHDNHDRTATSDSSIGNGMESTDWLEKR